MDTVASAAAPDLQIAKLTLVLGCFSQAIRICLRMIFLLHRRTPFATRFMRSLVEALSTHHF